MDGRTDGWMDEYFIKVSGCLASLMSISLFYKSILTRTFGNFKVKN